MLRGGGMWIGSWLFVLGGKGCRGVEGIVEA